MPIAQIPVKLFRENHMQPNQKDFFRVFAERLIARGFRFEQNEDCEWEPVYPVQFSRGDEFLVVTQNVPGRISNDAISGYLYEIRAGNFSAVSRLCGVLLAEGDDRAQLLDRLESAVPKDSTFFADTGDSRGTAGANTEPDAPMMEGQKVAEREVCRKALILFGVIEERF